MRLQIALAIVPLLSSLADALPWPALSRPVLSRASVAKTQHPRGSHWKPPVGWYGGEVTRECGSGNGDANSAYDHANCQKARASTCNTEHRRGCWTDTFGVHTDYEASVPLTGVTRHYTLVVHEEANWTGPDGVVKEVVMLINGSLPGPNLVADWGDRMEVTVVNNLKTNGTSMHWHGIRQLNTNLQDGVNGVTECPIAPGSSRTYNFLAQQYGTTWYHSHFSAQYGNGVVGTLQINGPASANYDIDLGVFPVTDYYYQGADALVDIAKNAGPPLSDNVLFNGTNVHPTSGAGAYAEVTLTKGKRHRLRIINTSVENHFVLSMVGHSMVVIANDLVPVQPQTVDQLFVAIGQRYDVTIEADNDVGSYWFNATFVTGDQCGASVNPYPAAVFRYQGADTSALPTDPGTTAVLDTCTDLTTLQPVVSRHISTSSLVAGAQDNKNQLNITLDLTQPDQLFTWRVNGTKVGITWNKPVDAYVMDGDSDYPVDDNVVVVDKKDKWIFWVIENDPDVPIAHPIHLHGHDFLLLARSDPNNGSSVFQESDLANLNGNNPTRRDVAMLPSQGWMVIAYKTDNPGTWIMHCHIAWHVSGGLAVNFLERPADLAAGISPGDKAAFDSQCAAWNDYFPANDPYPKQDSGLRRRREVSNGVSIGSAAGVTARTVDLSQYFDDI